MRFAYADPPYHGLGKRLYAAEHDDAARWDDESAHRELADELMTYYPDGWVLSCNPRDIPMYAEFFLGADYRIAAWTKTYHQWRPVSVQYAWEPVFFCGGRSIPRRAPFVRDWYSCSTALSGSLIGSKPPGFCRWVLDLLGFDVAQDTLDDLFPGTGVMSSVMSQGVLT